MLSTPQPPPGGGGRNRRRALLASVLGVLLAAISAPPGAAASVDPSGAAASVDPPGTADVPATDAAGDTYPVTLLTGDLVMLHVAPDGSQAAWLAEAANDRPSRPPQIIKQDGQVHVIPAEASPYVHSGALDERLFNVTALARQGYDDTSRPDLPLLLAPEDGSGAAAAPQVPAGAEEVQIGRAHV